MLYEVGNKNDHEEKQIIKNHNKIIRKYACKLKNKIKTSENNLKKNQYIYLECPNTVNIKK